MVDAQYCGMLMCNIQGIQTYRNKNKVAVLREKAMEENVVLISAVETHLNPDIADAEVQMEGFKLFRADRKKGTRKGGVATYVRDDLASEAKVLSYGSEKLVEYLILELKQTNIVVATVYRPPASETQGFLKVLQKIRETIDASATEQPDMIIMGDFNFPNIVWDSMMIKGGTTESQVQGRALLDFMDYMALEQYIKQPTRQMNILDLLLVNEPDMVRKVHVEDTEMSDHKIITVEARIGLASGTKNKNFRWREKMGTLNFMSEKVDWLKLKHELSEIDWTNEMNNRDVDEMYDAMYNKIYNTSCNYVPQRKSSIKKKVPRDRKILMRKRAKILKKIETRQSSAVRERLRSGAAQVEEDLINSHRRETQREEEKAVQAIKSNHKYFFSYARSKSTLRDGLGPLETDGKVVVFDNDKAEVLLEQFTSVFSAHRYTPAEIDQIVVDGSTNTQMEDITITEQDLKTSIMELKNTSAPGPDGVPVVLFKKCMEELATPLCIMWKESLSCGKIAEKLKAGLVVPIFKSGERHIAKNYRPVTVTSHIVKIFERVIVRKLTKFMEERQLFNQFQHGFRKGRSCLSQLLEQQAEILDALCNGCAVDVVYLDFAKAFDKVDHGILLKKFADMGVDKELLQWIRDFSTLRKQKVEVNGCFSRESEVRSGVPQGSVLGPLLFLVFIADIDKDVSSSKIASFADDTRMLKEIKSSEDCESLQQDLKNVFQWVGENNMARNNDKFEALRYEGNQTYKTAKFIQDC